MFHTGSQFFLLSGRKLPPEPPTQKNSVHLFYPNIYLCKICSDSAFLTKVYKSSWFFGNAHTGSPIPLLIESTAVQGGALFLKLGWRMAQLWSQPPHWLGWAFHATSEYWGSYPLEGPGWRECWDLFPGLNDLYKGEDWDCSCWNEFKFLNPGMFFKSIFEKL